jgi:3-oxoacyl-[acyl-carrier protein] reductase
MALQYIMDLGLQGKIALVTGGSGNIGFEIAHRLGQEGAGIAICGRNSITVNCVAPGPVGNDHPLQHVTKNFPIPRPATTDEIADLVAFLCSSRAGYLTGLTIPFDGGACRRMV